MGPSEPPVRFGTDGIRGRAGIEITPELALAVGGAVAEVFPGVPLVVAGDTRRSTPGLAAAAAAGAAHRGAEVWDLGVAPTPAAAFVASRTGAAALVVSASHNPATDNGLKVLAPGGAKLTDADQAAIERQLTAPGPSGPPGRPPGRVLDRPTMVDAWAEHLVGTVGDLGGLRVVLDCAHGAASGPGPAVLAGAGAVVEAVWDAPDGDNINAGCGAVHPEAVAGVTVRRGAEVGFAVDGDADRVVAADGTGTVHDGDAIIAVCARRLLAEGRLPGPGVVVTVMSNLGLRRSLAAAGVEVVEVPVGDRHVAAELARRGWSLGGEQSGHVIFTDLAPTGDGLLTALQVCETIVRAGRPLGELVAGCFQRLPQVLRNVPVPDPAAAARRAAAVTREVTADLGEDGRVVVRPSGTEPVLRIMVEAPTGAAAEEAAARIAAAATADT